MRGTRFLLRLRVPFSFLFLRVLSSFSSGENDTDPKKEKVKEGCLWFDSAKASLSGWGKNEFPFELHKCKRRFVFGVRSVCDEQSIACANDSLL